MRSWFRAFAGSLTAVLLVLAPAVGAETPAPELPFVHPLFTDNMVLQRDRPVPVWGWTEPGREVAVTAQGATVKAVADKGGKWMAKVGPFPAGGPFTLTVSGPQTVVFTNVLAGDVWLCSGQSNMEMGMGGVSNAQEEIATANFPQIRLFTVPRVIATEPQALVSTNSRWVVCGSNTVRNFSAVGFFFGRHLHRDLSVPVGLIESAWGGTVAEAWTSLDALRAMPDFAPEIERLAKTMEEGRNGEAGFTKAQAEWYRQCDPGAAAPGWEAADLDTMDWKHMALPKAWELAVLPSAEIDMSNVLGKGNDVKEEAEDESQLAKFDGIVWFRKEVNLPADWAGKDLALSLGPVDDADTTWFNGALLGGVENKALPREYKVPGKTVQAGRNVIAVRVLDIGGPGGFVGQPDQMRLQPAAGAAASLALAGDWQYRIGAALTAVAPLPRRETLGPNTVSVLFDGMIAPLIPYGIKGAIWYQGESNAARGRQYRTLLPAMIRDWRARFGAGEFPFCIVQLANFMASQPEPAESGWAELREAQWLTTQTVPQTGLAVTIDIGEAANIHPRNKQDVGLRLALAALAIGYDRKIEYSGPQLVSAVPQGGKLRLTFNHADGGLVCQGEKLAGFAIAGAGGKYVWADAVIDGPAVVLSSPAVEQPVSARYGWADNPESTLYNRAGLPAVPFRTDSPK